MAGLPFVWLGMVAAISLLEAPLKFRAVGVSREEALAVGQLVFPALNAVEVGLAAALLLVLRPRRSAEPHAWRLALATTAVLLVQVLAVRPVLHASTEAVLAGTSDGGAPWHWVYIALEGGKLLLLLALGSACVAAVVRTAAAPRVTP
jgi:hypothetical protein